MLASIAPYQAIGVTILLVGITCVVMIVLGHWIGPKRHGPVKDSPYESGMPVIVDTQRRFNIRFYIVAVLFLLFDVEVVFMWPWAQAFYKAATEGTMIPLESGGEAGKGFPEVTQRITVAHEMAHTLGVDHGIELMHPDVQTNAFAAQSLRELREYQGP